jgi:hypothetical protein
MKFIKVKRKEKNKQKSLQKKIEQFEIVLYSLFLMYNVLFGVEGCLIKNNSYLVVKEKKVQREKKDQKEK